MEPKQRSSQEEMRETEKHSNSRLHTFIYGIACPPPHPTIIRSPPFSLFALPHLTGSSWPWLKSVDRQGLANLEAVLGAPPFGLK